MSDIKLFPPMDPEALLPLAFNFAAFLGAGATIASVSYVSAAVHKGVDATPATRLYGVPLIDGTRVVQWLRYPVAGCVYKLRARILTSDGREYPLTGLLPIRET